LRLPHFEFFSQTHQSHTRRASALGRNPAASIRITVPSLEISITSFSSLSIQQSRQRLRFLRQLVILHTFPARFWTGIKACFVSLP
jgi:hypothetical protein